MSLTETARKVQVTGKSTYIISLPRRWVKEMNIAKGETLTIVPQPDNSLLLVPRGAKRLDKPLMERILVASKDNPNSIIRKLVALYLIGYNTIHILTKEAQIPSNVKKAVKEFVRRKLIGTEIVSDARNEIILQVLLSYPELSVSDALRRMCIIASSMHRDAVNALKDMNAELAEEIIRIDDEVDRFNFYIVRQLKAAVSDDRVLHEIGLETPRDCLGYRLITKSVERIADHAVNISRNILVLQNSIPEPVIEALEEMSDFAVSGFEQAAKSLFTKNYSLADEVIERNLKIRALEESIVDRIINMALGPETVSVLRLIVESIRRTSEYGSDIAEIVLNLTIPLSSLP
jgi:phosphate uptake regulator